MPQFPSRVFKTTGLLVLLVVLFGSFSVQAQVVRAFAQRYSGNTNGNINLIGNTLLTCTATDAGCATAQAGTNASTTAVNDNFNMTNVDVDTDTTTANSSSANLTMPAGSTVLFAGLYWGARSNNASRNQVRFRTPAMTAYATLTASQLDANTTFTPNPYQGFVDVTTQVQAAGVGTYTVGGVQATLGTSAACTNGGCYAGWGLVVVYSNPAELPRNLVVYDGLYVVNASNNVTINLAGFQTPPSGAVDTQLGSIVYEGDLNITGDAFQINGTALTNATNPANNYFNSSVTNITGAITAKNPNYVNQLSFDLDEIQTNLLGNGATTATLTMTSNQDQYYPGVVTFSTQLYAPNIAGGLTKTVSDVNGGDVNPGDILEYTMTVPNSGSNNATSLVLTDPIPANTTYVPGSLVVSTGANAGAKTDATGDDQANFVAGSNQVVFRLGTGANATVGGTLAPAASTSVKFRVQVNAGTAANTVIPNTATVTFGLPTGGTDSATASASSTVLFPDLNITKTHTGNFVRGQTGSYTLAVANGGTGVTLGTVTVTDTVPAGLTPGAATGTGWTCNTTGQTVTCTRSDALAAGASYPAITLPVTVLQSAPSSLTNSASVAVGNDPNSANNSSNDPTTIVSQVNLTVSKTDSQTSDVPGTSIAYTIVVSNSGPSDLVGGTLNDTFDATRLTSFTWTCAVTGAATCPASGSGDIAASINVPVGASVTFTATGNILPGATGTLSNTASVAMPSGTTNTGASSATDTTTLTPQADLGITKTHTGNFTVGTNGTYTITVTNNGSSTATGVVVTDTLPTGLGYVSGSSGWACSATGQTVTCNASAALAPGASSTLTLTVSVGAAAVPNVTNSASVSSAATDPVSGNNSATDPTVVGSLSLSGTVYRDDNANGVRDLGEPGIAGVAISLSGGATTTTDASGNYVFNALAPGTYTITETDPSGHVSTTSNTLTTTAGVNTGYNFGDFKGSVVTGRVFLDDGYNSQTTAPYSVVASANNAVQNTNEVGVPNTTVSASDGTNTVTAITDGAGDYVLYVPDTFGAAVTLSHNRAVGTGTNIAGANVQLASAYNTSAARSRSIAGFAAGISYNAYNFGVVYPALLQADETGVTTSPGTVQYTHLYRPGTLGTATLSVAGAYSYLVYRDTNCDGSISSAERAVASNTWVVDANWPREANGQLKACALEVVVLVPAGRANGEMDLATLTISETWQNNAVVLDLKTVRDTTRVGTGGNVNLAKRVRNVTQNSAFGVSAGGKPQDILEYCIDLANTGTSSVSNVVFRDPVPFFTDFVAGGLTLNGITLTDASDADAGELAAGVVVVRVGTLAPGASASVCYRAKIR